MHAGTGRWGLLLAGLLLLTLLVSTPVAGQEELRRDTTMDGAPTTPSGDVIGELYQQIMWLSIAVFVVVAVILLYILIRFRHKRGEKREVPQIHGNSKLEIAWTIGPALVMIWLLIISYNGLLAVDIPDAEPEVEISVRASQFTWEFTYPDGNTSTRTRHLVDRAGEDERTLPTMRVQEDTWVRLLVTSTDVIHAINVPGLDVMIDALPGKENAVQFLAREPGVYLVQCRQFCGTGHGEMLAAVEVFPAGTQPLPYGAAPVAAPPAPPVDGDDSNQTGNQTGNETNETADVTIDVRAFEWGFEPFDPLANVEPGQTVQINFRNDGRAPHNLFIGEYDDQTDQGTPNCTDPNDEATCWTTQFQVAAGGTDTITFTVPSEPTAYRAWCDIPSHAPNGMLTWFSVGGATPTVEDFEPRLPGPGFALAALALVGAAVFVARRRG